MVLWKQGGRPRRFTAIAGFWLVVVPMVLADEQFLGPAGRGWKPQARAPRLMKRFGHSQALKAGLDGREFQ